MKAWEPLIAIILLVIWVLIAWVAIAFERAFFYG